MAQMVGDGPNRGKSAPPPRRLPKAAAGAAAGAQAGAPKALPKPQPFSRWKHPFREHSNLLDFTPELKKPEVDLAPKKATPDYDAVMAEVWGNLENEGAAGEMKRQRGEVVVDPAGERAMIVQNVADMMNAKAAIGARETRRLAREKKDRAEKDVTLSPREWARLTPMQQAAVQANADLSAAVAADFKNQSKGKATDEQFKAHEDRVNDLFGEEGRTGFKGLEYAPQTLAFLESRGIDKAALAGKSLDDLVSGDALIDMDTMKALGVETSPTEPRAKNIAFAQRLAKGQLQYQEDLAAKLKAGKQLISSLTGVQQAADATTKFGAKAGTPGHIKLDKVRPETLGQFDIYLQALARSDSDPDKALKAITTDLEQRGATPEESAQVWEGLIERTRQASTGEGMWFPGVEFPMRSPIEVAQKLGAPALKRRGEK